MEREHYAALADLEEWHWWHRARQRILPAVLAAELRRLELVPPLRILDVGCGTGKFTSVLGRFGRVYGAEIDAEAAQIARGKGCGTILVADGGKLPFPDRQFDLVNAMEVIEHVPDDQVLLREFRRVLRPGG